MTTTRPQIPVTNLRERIAALEQRNAGNGASRPTSPTPSAPPAVGAVATGFRDKIAKFEKKGGVPVPRGSFGLGAPPTSDGPRRRGELYGNRIPAPARAVSVGGSILPSTRPSSPTDTLGIISPGSSPTFGEGDRRSFSLSSVVSDGDGPDDYTPISSPTFAFPPESPESLMSAANHIETSPTSSPVEDVPGSNKFHILRGTSFQKALEIAKNAETAKLEANEPIAPPPRQRSHDNEDAEIEPLPAIVVSSEDVAPPVMHDSPSAVPPRPLPPVPVVVTTTQPELKVSGSAVAVQKDVTIPQIREEVAVPVIPVTPLTIRKRRPTDPTLPEVEEIVHEVVPPIPSTATPTVVVHEPPPASTIIQDDSHLQKVVPIVPAPEILPEVIPEVQYVMPTVMVHEPSPTKQTYDEVASISPNTVPTPTLPIVIQTNDTTPQIVLHEDVIFSTETAPRKADLSLSSELINDQSLTSPSLETGNTSVVSLTDMLGNFFTSKDANGDPIARPATPPSHPPASPLSPLATLAYDGPDSPAKPIPPTIEVPDPQSFLSPPPSGFRSSALSSGGGSSISSLGSRPMSMIETSPGNVSRAMRMTPATSRGVPVFLPPTSAQPRKSDFVYFPPTPEDAEFGSATLHKSSQSLSMGSTPRASEMVINDPSARPNTTFTAVVHGKVRETPAAATLPASFKQQRRMPETPQMKRVQRMTMMEPPASPAQGELAALLQEAVLLEDSLDRGELPTEANVRLEAEEKERKERESAAAAAAWARKAAEDEERQRIAAAAERLKAKRDEPTSGKLKHTFLVPLSKARSAHRKEASTPQLDSFPPQLQDDLLFRPKSAGLPEKSSAHTSHNSQVQRPVTPENKNSGQYLETPPKPSRFSNFRRLGSVSARPNTIHGHSNRHSASTSSEDSAPVITPPETRLEFGSSKHSTVSEFGQMPANGSTTSFPTLSPKKSSTSIGRAASFAERVFSRSRTKSNGSILSATSEMTVSTIDRIPEDAPSLPVISIEPLPSTTLPPLPSTPAIVLPISETETKVLHPPRRSTSLARSSRLPPLPTEVVPPLPTITPSAFFSTTAETADVSGDSLMIPNTTADDTRPSSWTSMSSAGSLPSPLFDKALYDAFPSVPEMTPALSATASLHKAPSRSVDPIISYERPSFDSDLLSSAIHLSSTYKSTPPSNVSLGRSATSVSRRSQEKARY